MRENGEHPCDWRSPAWRRQAERSGAIGAVLSIIVATVGRLGMRKILIASALAVFAGHASAEDAMRAVTPDEMVWKEHPVFKGAMTAVVIGDLSKADTNCPARKISA